MITTMATTAKWEMFVALKKHSYFARLPFNVVFLRIAFLVPYLRVLLFSFLSGTRVFIFICLS